MSLVLSVTFFVFVIVIRISRQYYLSGDHGVRLAKSGAPLIEVVPGTVFILSFIVALVLVSVHASGWLTFANSLPGWTYIIGSIFGFAGILVTVIAQFQMGKSWRIGLDQNEHTSLISSGLYAKSRNPIYFGILLFWIGLVLTLPHPAMLACAIVSWVCIEIIVRKLEEPYLAATHGEGFSKYKASTRRYLPF